MYGSRVPANDPQVGETWQLGNNFGDPAELAVIVETTDNRITLVSRLGRRLAVPRQSYGMWTFVRDAPTNVHGCFQTGCGAQAWLRTPEISRDGSVRRWRWVCGMHVVVGNQVLLPSDNPDEVEAARLDECPACGSPRHNPADVPEGLPFSVRSCLRCNRLWTLLIGQGSEADGVNLGENIRDVVEALESEGEYQVRVRIGRVAFAALRRAVGRLGMDPGHPHLVGTQLIRDDSFGSNNAVCIAYLAHEVRGVQRLGGQPSSDDAQTNPPVIDIEPTGSTPNPVARQATGAESILEAEDERILETIDRIATSPQPRKDDVWWEREQNMPATITKVDGEMISFRRRDGLTGTLAKERFQTDYRTDAPTPKCKVGEEWEDSQGTSIIVTEVDTDSACIYVRNPNGSPFVIPVWEFGDNYKKLERKTVYERLLDDDTV